MTKQEAIDLLKNRKVYVNGRSAEIQKKLFELEFEWTFSKKEVTNTGCPFLYMTNKEISSGNDMGFFMVCTKKEISAEKILAIDIVPEFKENDIVVSGWETEDGRKCKWIAIYDQGSNTGYYYKVCLFLERSNNLPNSIDYAGHCCSQNWTRLANKEEKQKLIDALKSSSDERAKPILKEVFGVEECPFKPFDKVLVRDDDDEEWKPAFFWKKVSSNNYPYVAISDVGYSQCIPYEGNENLIDTSNNPE